MIVTFISECQKNSLKLTRAVLDAYAHRIGQRTWQATMTEQGLQAVRSRLSKTARKTTAVACHRICGSRRTELVWIVGNRRCFDDQGNVPTNRTKRDLLKERSENDWQYLSVLKAVVAIASLFHDFGKAWDPFQTMLRRSLKKRNVAPDPIRHEWISLLLFLAFTAQRDDTLWLAELSDLNKLSPEQRREYGKKIIEDAKTLFESSREPFKATPSLLAKWIGWLIVSHHRLPHLDSDQFSPNQRIDESNLLGRIRAGSGFEKLATDTFDAELYWKFASGLPLLSDRWCKEASRWGRKLGDEIALYGTSRLAELAKSQRILLTLSRVALMLGDHEYSSVLRVDDSWPRSLDLFANTAKGKFRQRLDEHLVRVTDASLKIAHLLPAFEAKLPVAENPRPLRKPSPPAFAWQNRAIEQLRNWQKDVRVESVGFFAINMASTGKGKTFANARIMDAIAPRGLRFSLALGLRTLTLQTGDEYRERLRLDETELAVMIGSSAVKVLHEQRRVSTILSGGSLFADELPDFGSESTEDSIASFDFQHDDLIPDDTISTVVSSPKGRQLLKSPVLVCTIDHLMPAVEGTRGGRQILPLLRLLSADLVLDEVDDFDHSDMPAIARLVHLAGMLGRKVMISSATIAPAIAEGLFHAYREGWCEFARFRNRSAVVHGFWVDEFSASTTSLAGDEPFRLAHMQFVDKRIRKLNSDPVVARRAIVRNIKPDPSRPLPEQWFSEMSGAAIELHRSHALRDPLSGKRVSVGIIRLANVDPCIDLTGFLLDAELPDDLDLRVMTYHARQVLLLRSEQERHLDTVLNRKGGRSPFNDPILRQHIGMSDKPNLMFIVVATPVAEVGRDHDYDWAVVEPSSMRSIIQMAGRVRRHRVAEKGSVAANVSLPDLNFKAFTGRVGPVFEKPGFEGGSRIRGGGYFLSTKRMSELVDVEKLANKLDSSSRIAHPGVLRESVDLAHLEHRVLGNILTEPDLRPAFNRGWTACGYYLSDVSQWASRFRQSADESPYKLHLTDEGFPVFRHTDPSTGRSDGPLGKEVSNLTIDEVSLSRGRRLWLVLNYADLIESQQSRLGRGKRGTCEFLGELNLRDQQGSRRFTWSTALGARTQS
jgi:CRISPR-associated endonuclease/helicase Cas3